MVERHACCKLSPCNFSNINLQQVRRQRRIRRKGEVLMKRLWVVALSIALCSIFGYYYGARLHAAEIGEFDNFTSWSPNVETLRKQMGDVTQQGAVGSAKETRNKHMGEQLTLRFRGHDPKIAVRVKFEHDRNH